MFLKNISGLSGLILRHPPPNWNISNSSVHITQLKGFPAIFSEMCPGTPRSEGNVKIHHFGIQSCQAASRICRIPENRSRHYHFLTDQNSNLLDYAGWKNPCTFVLYYMKKNLSALQLKHCRPYSKSSSLESLVGDGQQAPGSVASCEFVDIKRELLCWFFHVTSPTFNTLCNIWWNSDILGCVFHCRF